MFTADMNSPQTLRRGNSLRSTMATDLPWSARARATDEPAGPAPMMMASYLMESAPPRRHA